MQSARRDDAIVFKGHSRRGDLPGVFARWQAPRHRQPGSENQALEPRYRQGIRDLEGHTSRIYAWLSLPTARHWPAVATTRLSASGNVATGKESTIFKGHKASVRCVVFASDGKTLASGGGDRTIKCGTSPRAKHGQTSRAMRARQSGRFFR